MKISEWRLLRAVPLLFARMGMMLSKYWDSTRRRDRIKLLLKIRCRMIYLSLKQWPNIYHTLETRAV
jgi:hypothetical protein